MSCNCNCAKCTDQEPCNSDTCSCPIEDFPTSCILYNGVDLDCVDIESPIPLNEVIEGLDTLICDRIAYVISLTNLVNLGDGAKVYRPNILSDVKEIRTIKSENTDLLDIIENSETIEVKAGTHSLDLESNILSLIIETLSGETILSEIDFSEYVNSEGDNTFLQDVIFSNNIVTFQFNNGVSDIQLDLSALLDNINVSSGSYSNNTITLTLTDTNTVDIDLTNLVNEILVAATVSQVQADVLETTTTSKAYIQNKNPHKTEVLGVAGNYNVLDADNNYIIEIDNGTNDVTIDFSTITDTNNFFVGFIQKGTGLVTFNNADIVQQGFTNQLYGQGHPAAIEVISSTKYLLGTLKAI